MALFKDGAFIEDAWRMLGAEEPLPADGAVVVPLARWRAERGALAGRGAPTGVLVLPGEAVEDIAPELSGLALIALAFPKYTDGRAYSTAHRLRTRCSYRGELRAVGDVLLDQLQLMRRCGFDSFEISNPATIAALRRGHVAGVSRFYQPSLDRNEIPAGTRPWLRTGSRT